MSDPAMHDFAFRPPPMSPHEDSGAVDVGPVDHGGVVLRERHVPARPLAHAPTGPALAAPRVTLQTAAVTVEVLVDSNDGHSVYTNRWAARGDTHVFQGRRSWRGMTFDEAVAAARGELVTTDPGT